MLALSGTANLRWPPGAWGAAGGEEVGTGGARPKERRTARRRRGAGPMLRLGRPGPGAPRRFVDDDVDEYSSDAERSDDDAEGDERASPAPGAPPAGGAAHPPPPGALSRFSGAKRNFAAPSRMRLSLTMPSRMSAGRRLSGGSSAPSHELDESPASVAAAVAASGRREWKRASAGTVRRWIIKATSSEPGAPKPKYVRKLIVETWECARLSGPLEPLTRACVTRLVARAGAAEPAVAFKALVALHRLMSQGPQEAVPTHTRMLPELRAALSRHGAGACARDGAATVAVSAAAAASAAVPARARSASPRSAWGGMLQAYAAHLLLRTAFFSRAHRALFYEPNLSLHAWCVAQPPGAMKAGLATRVEEGCAAELLALLRSALALLDLLFAVAGLGADAAGAGAAAGGNGGAAGAAGANGAADAAAAAAAADGDAAGGGGPAAQAGGQPAAHALCAMGALYTAGVDAADVFAALLFALRVVDARRAAAAAEARGAGGGGGGAEGEGGRHACAHEAGADAAADAAGAAGGAADVESLRAAARAHHGALCASARLICAHGAQLQVALPLGLLQLAAGERPAELAPGGARAAAAARGAQQQHPPQRQRAHSLTGTPPASPRAEPAPEPEPAQPEPLIGLSGAGGGAGGAGGGAVAQRRAHAFAAAAASAPLLGAAADVGAPLPAEWPDSGCRGDALGGAPRTPSGGAGAAAHVGAHAPASPRTPATPRGPAPHGPAVSLLDLGVEDFALGADGSAGWFGPQSLTAQISALLLHEQPRSPRAAGAVQPHAGGGGGAGGGGAAAEALPPLPAAAHAQRQPAAAAAPWAAARAGQQGPAPCAPHPPGASAALCADGGGAAGGAGASGAPGCCAPGPAPGTAGVDLWTRPSWASERDGSGSSEEEEGGGDEDELSAPPLPPRAFDALGLPAEERGGAPGARPPQHHRAASGFDCAPRACAGCVSAYACGHAGALVRRWTEPEPQHHGPPSAHAGRAALGACGSQADGCGGGACVQRSSTAASLPAHGRAEGGAAPAPDGRRFSGSLSGCCASSAQHPPRARHASPPGSAPRTAAAGGGACSPHTPCTPARGGAEPGARWPADVGALPSSLLDERLPGAQELLLAAPLGACVGDARAEAGGAAPPACARVLAPAARGGDGGASAPPQPAAAAPQQQPQQHAQPAPTPPQRPGRTRPGTMAARAPPPPPPAQQQLPPSAGCGAAEGGAGGAAAAYRAASAAAAGTCAGPDAPAQQHPPPAAAAAAGRSRPTHRRSPSVDLNALRSRQQAAGGAPGAVMASLAAAAAAQHAHAACAPGGAGAAAGGSAAAHLALPPAAGGALGSGSGGGACCGLRAHALRRLEHASQQQQRQQQLPPGCGSGGGGGGGGGGAGSGAGIAPPPWAARVGGARAEGAEGGEDLWAHSPCSGVLPAECAAPPPSACAAPCAGAGAVCSQLSTELPLIAGAVRGAGGACARGLPACGCCGAGSDASSVGAGARSSGGAPHAAAGPFLSCTAANVAAAAAAAAAVAGASADGSGGGCGRAAACAERADASSSQQPSPTGTFICHSDGEEEAEEAGPGGGGGACERRAASAVPAISIGEIGEAPREEEEEEEAEEAGGAAAPAGAAAAASAASSAACSLCHPPSGPSTFVVHASDTSASASRSHGSHGSHAPHSSHASALGSAAALAAAAAAAESGGGAAAGARGGAGGAPRARHSHSRSVDARRAPSIEALSASAAIPMREIWLDRLVGRGSFAEVYRAEWRGTPVAVKRMLGNPLADARALHDFLVEASMLQSLRHPNIVLFMGVCVRAPHLCIVTEYVNNGNLFGLLRDTARRPRLPLALKLRMALDVARGMNFLHLKAPPVLHRDLKSLNLLVDEVGRVKITDFGLARAKAMAGANMTAQCGTWQWMAPEVLQSQLYSESADVYSYGIVLWELVTRSLPYEGLSAPQVAMEVSRGGRPEVPPASADAPERWLQLMVQCWHTEPSARPVFSEVLRVLLLMQREVAAQQQQAQQQAQQQQQVLQQQHQQPPPPQHQTSQPLAS